MKYTQGICDDGAVILCDGERLTVDEVVRRLIVYEKLLDKLQKMVAYSKPAYSMSPEGRAYLDKVGDSL